MQSKDSGRSRSAAARPHCNTIVSNRMGLAAPVSCAPPLPAGMPVQGGCSLCMAPPPRMPPQVASPCHLQPSGGTPAALCDVP